MQMQRFQKTAPLLLAFCFLSFVVLSWWLLFRDERALAGIGSFYPEWGSRLVEIREWLLARSLNVLPTLIFGLTGILAFAAYWFSLHVNISRRTSIIFAVAFPLIVFFSYPILSTDIFSYIYSDRVLVEYGQNPWLVKPGVFPDDPFGLLADWTEQTKVYGLVNQIIYLPAAVLGGGKLLPTVVTYKLVALIYLLLTLAIVIGLVRDLEEVKQANIIRALFWNPLLVLEFAGAGHNDIAMAFFLLLSLAAWQKNVMWLAGIILALSVQVKLIPLLIFGFFALSLLQKKQIRPLLDFGLGFAATNALAFLIIGISPLEFLSRVFYNTTVYWQSLPGLVSRFIPELGLPFSLIFIGVIAILAALQFKKNWSPIITSALALSIYLVFFNAANWNWYILLPFVLIMFAEGAGKLKNYLLLATFTDLLAYPLLWLSHRFGYGHPGWEVAIYTIIFWIPLVLIKFKLPQKLNPTPLLD